MSDGQASDNNAFSRAFLPGLILGLVVGGLCGAILPDIVAGSQRPDFKSTGHTGGASHGDRDESGGRDERTIDPDLDGDGVPDELDTENVEPEAGTEGGDPVPDDASDTP